MHRMYLNMLASSNGDRKRKAPEEGREMTHSPSSPPPPGFPIPRFRREGAGAGTPPPLNLQLRLGQPGSPSQLPPPPPPRFPTPLPLNPQLHLYQPGASSSLQSVTPHAPLDLKYYYNEAMSELLDEMRKRKQAWEMQKKAMEAMIANYRTQALIMAERVKALEKTNAALHVALHLQPTPPAAGGDGAASGEVVVVKFSCKMCWRESATMMAWPCRHLCMCNNCAGTTTKRCPVCDATFQDCIAVKFY